MAEMVSFEDAARELQVGTEEVTRLVASGELQTGEEGGLLKIDRVSLDSYKSGREEAPLLLTEAGPEPEPEVVPSLGLAAEGAAEEPEAEGEPVEAAAEAGGDTTESIFGDEDFELETFTETAEEGVRAEGVGAGEELAELEEAGEELGAEEMAELTAEAGAPVGRRAVRPRPETSTGVTVMLVVTFILLLFAGLVIFNFSRSAPQGILAPITDSLPLGGE